jgi:hypothetical protein
VPTYAIDDQTAIKAKDEVVEVDKTVVGFGLRVSRLGGVQLGAPDALMSSVFDMNFSFKVVGTG